MSHYMLRGTTAALALVFAAQGALADLSAADVWAEWRDYLAGVGYQVSGNESMSGNTLTVSDFSMSMQLPEGAGTFAIGLPEMAFAENGDGTVNVIFPPRIPMTFEVSDDGETVSGEIAFDQRDAAMVVSGSPADMSYAYAASEVVVSLASLTVDGDALPPDAGHVTVAVSDMTSSTQVRKAAMRSYSQTLSAASITYDIAFKDPDSSEHLDFSGQMGGIGFDGSGTIPMQFDPADFKKMLDAGFGIAGGFRYASGSSTLEFEGDGDAFSFASSSQGGSLGMAMDAAHLAYNVAQRGVRISVSGNELPFPVDVQMARSGFDLDMPVSASDQEQPFSFGMTLADFVMPDMLWAMFDPGAILPRDPATIELSLSGMARLFHDLLNPETAMAIEQSGQPPAELNALKIENMQVSMVGASLSGTGDFTFDNSDLVSYDGIPAPSGRADLKIVGANGLIDRLIQMGLVSDQDAMGARMMMGMLAVPGDAPDSLNSTIELKDGGQIIANGQRIK